LDKTVLKINALEPEMQQLSQQDLAKKTIEFKNRYIAGETLDQLLPEAFAVVRETAKRVLGQRHFDVQLIGGMVLHQGSIAEMRMGEGKTLVGTLPAYLNAISGDGVHVVTVNDYLAKRDSHWMAPIYEFLGLTVGVIYPDMPPLEKQHAYNCDITYGTNNEFGFDYLRDNMAFSLQDKVQRKLNFAIVDEVDSILIDEARTPLIISGAAEGNSDLYLQIDKLIPQIVNKQQQDNIEYFTLDEKQKQVHLTDAGHELVEELLANAGLLSGGHSLYHPANILLMHHIHAAFRAHKMFNIDVDYIVKDQQIIIVDEHTGRTMPGRRWSEGLHQAIEAKEGVPIQRENQTLASITFQNYFKIYKKLAGMTGTADTEAYEFQQIYNLDVVVIPTNKPMIRQDKADLIYLTQKDKYEAIIKDVKSSIEHGQPVLVGTASIEASELLSEMMGRAGIKHQVLNAKFHEKEAEIVAEAGRPGAVTIATNMAGRGTDIMLGGNLAADLKKLPEGASKEEIEKTTKDWEARHAKVISAGGLRILGSERHESRRIDNQLRGRSGRQGDPGSSQFYLSLDDNLMRIFASERVVNMMRKLGMEGSESIEHPLLNKAIENAQRKLEGFHFDIRKQLLEYDNVANFQRQVIYSERAAIMEMQDYNPFLLDILTEVVDNIVSQYIDVENIAEEWDVAGLTQVLADEFMINLDVKQWLHERADSDIIELKKQIIDLIRQKYRQKVEVIGKDAMNRLAKSVILQAMDSHWREHLAAMDYLRQGIHLRGYAQKDPRQEYKRESYELFTQMLGAMNYDIVRLLAVLSIKSDEDISALENVRRAESDINKHFIHNSEETSEQDEEARSTVTTTVHASGKLGRNDKCPCGSNKKFKHCHGKL
jgi:preprotein translocase subunit SecA